MSDDDLPPTECVYKVCVSDLGGVTFCVKTSLEEKTVDGEPIEIVKMHVTDLLTKSTYEASLDCDSVARMGSYLELDKFFVVTQAALDDLQKGSESTTQKIEFGYTIVEEEGDEGKTEVAFDRRSMTRAKRALKKKYSKLSKDPSAGNSLACSVTYSAGLISEFFAFDLPITNADDISQRLLSMMQDRKIEIDDGAKERGKLKAELQAARLENKDLYKKIAALEAQMNGILEGKEDDTVMKIASFYTTSNPSNDSYIKWDTQDFDTMGAAFIARENGNDTIKFQRDGLYRISCGIYMVASTSNYVALYRDGSQYCIAYHGTNCGTTYGEPYISRIMQIRKDCKIQFYVCHNNTAYGGEGNNFLQIEYIQPI